MRASSIFFSSAEKVATGAAITARARNKRAVFRINFISFLIKFWFKPSFIRRIKENPSKKTCSVGSVEGRLFAFTLRRSTLLQRRDFKQSFAAQKFRMFFLETRTGRQSLVFSQLVQPIANDDVLRGGLLC